MIFFQVLRTHDKNYNLRATGKNNGNKNDISHCIFLYLTQQTHLLCNKIIRISVFLHCIVYYLMYDNDNWFIPLKNFAKTSD